MGWQEKCIAWVTVLAMGAIGVMVGSGVANTPDHIRQQLGTSFVMLVASTVPTLMLMMCAALDNGGWSRTGKLLFVGMVSAYILGLWMGYLLLPLL